MCSPTDLSISPPGLVSSRCPVIVAPCFRPSYFVNSVHRLREGALAHALPRRCILDSIDRNIFSGTATSAIWNTIILEWETILAPIFISLSWMLDRDQWDTSLGRAKRRMKFPRLYASTNSARRTRLDTYFAHESRVRVSACFPSLMFCSHVPRLL